MRPLAAVANCTTRRSWWEIHGLNIFSCGIAVACGCHPLQWNSFLIVLWMLLPEGFSWNIDILWLCCLRLLPLLNILSHIVARVDFVCHEALPHSFYDQLKFLLSTTNTTRYTLAPQETFLILLSLVWPIVLGSWLSYVITKKGRLSFFSFRIII